MADTYSVLYTGQLKPGVELEQAVAAFSARFGVEVDTVRDMFEAGKETAIKAGLDESRAREYRNALDRIGLAVRVEPPLTDPDDEADAAPDPPGGEPAPGAPRDPFAPPEADLEDESSLGDFHEPRSVPAGRGWHWIREGFSMVFARPVPWIVAVVIWVILSLVLNLVPIVNLLAALITAVFTGGLMLGAYEQDNGREFTVGHLFAGFANRFGPLFLVGVLYMLGFLAIGLIMLLTMGGVLSALSGMSTSEAPLLTEAGPFVWVMPLIVLGLSIPLIMAYWFAPALVMLDNVSALSAMGLSFRACLKNILPFLVYGLIALVFLILGAIPLFLGLLIVIPGVIASIYTSYRDIFRG
jgi:uncharacterized membrane protein